MDIDTLHTSFIYLHAAAGVISFIAGVILITLNRQPASPVLFGVYFGFLAGLVAFLSGAMLVNWSEYTLIERVLFAGLFILSLFMLYRAQKASRMLKTRPNGWEEVYIEHIGFTLISLFEGFIIVTVINIGGPSWLVGVLAILGIVLGRRMIGSAKSRLEEV